MSRKRRKEPFMVSRTERVKLDKSMVLWGCLHPRFFPLENRNCQVLNKVIGVVSIYIQYIYLDISKLSDNYNYYKKCIVTDGTKNLPRWKCIIFEPRKLQLER